MILDPLAVRGLAQRLSSKTDSNMFDCFAKNILIEFVLRTDTE